MCRNVDGSDPLIGRAFALYDTGHDWVDLVYAVKGKFTQWLRNRPAGTKLGVWGPLGNSFACTPVDHLIMVAGGIGQTPFLTLAREALGKQAYGQGRRCGYASKVTFCYGAKSSEYFAGLDDFKATGAEVLLATDDGSVGPARLVTDLLNDVLASSSNLQRRIVCCGPEPMMQRVGEIAIRNDIDCQVSMETPMACGLGICFTCVAKVGTEQEWDYKRTCVEGPIFSAREIVW